MAAKIHPLLELRDAAYEAAAPAHERMKNEISLYRNEDYTGESWIKRFKRSVTRSISPQINTAINRLIPVFTEQMAHVNVEPIRMDASELERLATDELQEHLDNLEAVDSETEELRTLILHNQAMGNAISKTGLTIPRPKWSVPSRLTHCGSHRRRMPHAQTSGAAATSCIPHITTI